VVAPWVKLDRVTFFYDRGVFPTEFLVAPAIARYRVQKGRAIREAPLALNLIAFINEWIDLPKAEAAQWGV